MQLNIQRLISMILVNVLFSGLLMNSPINMVDELPTLKSLPVILKEDLNFSGSKGMLQKISELLIFKWRSHDNRKLLIEGMSIHKLRLKFERVIKNF